LEATSIALRDYCHARRDPNATPEEIARRLAKFEEFQAKWIAMVDKPKRKLRRAADQQ
jgi:hypothetical protein